MRRGVLAVAFSVVLVAAPRAAPAAVDIGADRIAVTGEGARVVVDRSPFRMTFQDGAGRTVLSQVENSRPAPQVVPPAPDPQPLGADNVDGPTLYAPLVFTVGDRTSVQYPLTAWVGNQLAGTESGTRFAARDVVQAAPAGSGARILVSTSDPTGRRLAITLTPGDGFIRVSVRPTPAGGVVTLGDSFATFAGEAFRGFGGRHNALDQRGNDFYNWVEQQNTGAGPFQPGVDALPGTGGRGYQFPNGPAAAYYVQSQFVSSRGYGFLLDRDELSAWRMASDRPDAWQVAAGGPALDYVVAPGAAKRAIGTLTSLGGRQRVPPAWALGPQLDRLTRFSGETRETYTQSVRQDLDDIERYDLPLTAYRFEAWHFLDRDFLKEAIVRLRRRGIRSLLYFRAFVGQDDIGTDRPQDFDEAVDQGYVARTPTGQPFIFISNFNVPSALIDFTNPEAVRWWEGRLREALDLGADGFMQDFGEQVLEGMRFADGSTGETMHNRYPVLFHKTTADFVDRYERENPGRDIWFYTRAGYSGTPGSAAYEGANFPGDETTDWSRSTGIASLATDMLNRGIGGAFGFGTDIGGYFDFHTPPTTKELFLRWAQWATLSPVMRLHGSINAGTHTPWSYDAETLRIYEALSRLRLRAAPLILRLWREAARTGVPIARPLWLEYPAEPEAARQDQQWLLGRDVLVAPVVEEGATTRGVYLPRGCWQEQNTGSRYTGPRSVRVDAPLDRLPYFFRCGTDPFATRPTRGRCRDTTAPSSRITRGSLRAGRAALHVRGIAVDRGCRGRVRRVYVSVARVEGSRCRFVGRDGRLQRRSRACRPSVLVAARGARRWRFSLRRARLAPGRYRLWTSARDARGNRERARAAIDFRVR